MHITRTPVSAKELSQMGDALSGKIVLIQKNPEDPKLSYAVIMEFLPQTGEAYHAKEDGKIKMKIHHQDKFAVMFDNGCGGPIALDQIKAITTLNLEYFAKVIRLTQDDPSLCEIHSKPAFGFDFPTHGFGC